jgi:hypothetical protein
VQGCLLRVSETQQNDPQTLYRRREDSQWSRFAIDLIGVPPESF